VKENLTEEELAIFDLLLKENLKPKETEKVRLVARELLATLKTKKLVLDWRERAWKSIISSTNTTGTRSIWFMRDHPGFAFKVSLFSLNMECFIQTNLTIPIPFSYPV
jgi:hypothetical protein